jgi:chorismate-pyruvate lyase
LDEVEMDLDRRLSDVERLLLSTDGTVTHMLEVHIDGPVEVDIQDRSVSGSTLTRRVVLRDSSTAAPLVWAESSVNLHPLSTELEDELVHGDTGIGDLLRDEYVDTHREIVDIQAISPDDYADGSFPPPDYSTFVERTYKIYSGNDRLMTITEWFSVGLL